MAISHAFDIGRSALTASQVAIQVAGNNLANLATPGYSRQSARLSPVGGDGLVRGLGGGVRVRDVRRQVDTALQARLWSSASDASAAQQKLDLMASIESSLNELSDQDLSSELSSFFNAWSDRANQVQSSAVVVGQATKLAGVMKRMRADLAGVRNDLDQRLARDAESVNTLLDEIADLNGRIARDRASGGAPNAVQDRRDQAIGELSELLDVTAVEQPTGEMNILAGSTPLVLLSTPRHVELQERSTDAGVRVEVRLEDDGTRLEIQGGTLGGLLAARADGADDTIDRLDRLASQLIFQVNRLHSVGVNAAGLTSATALRPIDAGDRSLALNDPDNASIASLPFGASNGGFDVRVRQVSTGAIQTVRIPVDLDGLDSTGATSRDEDSSIASLAASLDAIEGVRASVGADGRLSIEADEGFDFSFGEDSSGVLAVLGVNAFFAGTGADDIAVVDELIAEPNQMMAGLRRADGTFIENGTALAVAGLQDTALVALGGQTLRTDWTTTVQRVASGVEGARSTADAAGLVLESLEAQRAAVSGVSADEEAINLLNFQRSYEGAARYLNVVDQLTQTLLTLV